MSNGRFAIVNRTHGRYVAQPGARSSYTRMSYRARTFPSRQAAEANCCGDEHVVELTENEMRPKWTSASLP